MIHFRDQRHALVVAVVLTAAAAFAWHDAYEGRGRRRPFWARFATGVL